MPIYKVNNEYLVYKGKKIAEAKFRKELSKLIIDKFGKDPYEQTVITDIIIFSLNYYIAKFETICRSEKSYTFYKNVFWFHEQATEITHKDLVDENTPKGISGNYIAAYRRILKFIIEMGCEIEMLSGEKVDDKYKLRTELILDDLLFLGEMIMMCVDLYAEQRMIEDVAEITFNSDGLYTFSRRHHYEFIFEYISKEFSTQITKHIIDPNGFSDFEDALLNCFGIKYSDVGQLIGYIHQKLKLEHGETVAVGWETFILNMASLPNVTSEIAEQFFSGLRLDKINKMSLHDLVCKPYNLNRFIYRPIAIWKIDGKEFGVLGGNSWAESFIQLTTNSIPWGKAPKEWIANSCFKDYVHRKEDEHDKWLDDAVEQKITSIGLMYDRNVKNIKSNNAVHSIEVAGLGEIDFIIVSESLKKIFISDSKHLLGRYDIVNQKNDYNAFAVGSKKTKPYNETLADKLAWFRANSKILEEHFKLKYKQSELSFDDFTFEGIFVVNSPTFYMYNADYRIYTIDQIADVLLGKFADPTFAILVEEEESETFLHVKYPFFKKPKYVVFDSLDDDEAL